MPTSKTCRGILTSGLAALLAAGAVAGDLPPAAMQAPSPGDVIPAFDAEATDGTVKHVGFPKGSATVLLFFSSGCPVCHRMIPEWNRLLQRKPKELAVVGVIVDREPPGFFDAVPVAFPVVRSLGRDWMNGLKVQKVPLTLRVGPGGRVEDAGLGVLDDIRLGQLFRP